MPLFTSITRNGERRTMPHGWGWWHLECMTEVVRTEVGGLDDAPILGGVWSDPRVNGSYTATLSHEFIDPADGEVLTIERGDVLNVWRQ